MEGLQQSLKPSGKRISITLQKCNSRVILRKLPRLSSVHTLGDGNVLGIDKDI